jgi:lipopolysaccharide/colanic/teichoic acid biosynthesis glycosyltransferase
MRKLKRSVAEAVKFIFDRTVGFSVMIALAPAILLIAMMIWFTEGRPAFFVQTRLGKDSRPFRMIKFRTMTFNDGTNTITVKGDPRITNIGSFLRKHKLDELPEILHVVLGRMSFVGPRPDVPGCFDYLEGEDRKILNLRPGITGPATLKYRNEEEILARVPDPKRYNNEVIFPDKVRINREYYEHNNLIIDLRIIFKTVVYRK